MFADFFCQVIRELNRKIFEQFIEDDKAAGVPNICFMHVVDDTSRLLLKPKDEVRKLGRSCHTCYANHDFCAQSIARVDVDIRSALIRPESKKHHTFAV